MNINTTVSSLLSAESTTSSHIVGAMNSINNDRPLKDGRQHVSSLYPVYNEFNQQWQAIEGWKATSVQSISSLPMNSINNDRPFKDGRQQVSSLYPVYNELNQQWQAIQGWKATSVQSISSLPMNSINKDRPFKDGRQQVASLYPVYQWTQSTMIGHSRMEGNKWPVYIQSTNELNQQGQAIQGWKATCVESISSLPMNSINNDRPFKDGRQQVASLYPVYQWTQSTMTGHSRMEGNKCPVYIQSTNELNQQWQAIQGWKATSVQSISSLPMNSINNDRPFKDGRQQVSSLHPVYQWTQSTMTGHSRMEGNKWPVYIQSTNELNQQGHSRMEGNMCPVYIQSTNELNQQWQAIQGWKATSVQSIYSLPMNSINNDRPFKDGRQQVSSLYPVYQWTQSTMTGHSRMEGNKWPVYIQSTNELNQQGHSRMEGNMCPVYIQSTNELNQQWQAIQGWKATSVQSISSLPMNSNQQWQAIQGWKATRVQSISSLPMNSINNDRPFKDGRQQVSSLYPVYQWTQSTMTGHSRMEGNKWPVYIQSTNELNQQGHSRMEGNMCPVYIQSTNELNQQWQAIQGWKATSVQSISSLPMNSINNDRPFKDGRQQVSSLYPVYQWTQSTMTGHSRMEGNKWPVYIQSTNELNQQGHSRMEGNMCPVHIQSTNELNQQWQAIQGWKATSVQSIYSLPMNSINNDRPFKDGRQQVASLYPVYQWTQSTMTGHSRMEGNKCPVYIQSTNELN